MFQQTLMSVKGSIPLYKHWQRILVAKNTSQSKQTTTRYSAVQTLNWYLLLKSDTAPDSHIGHTWDIIQSNILKLQINCYCTTAGFITFDTIEQKCVDVPSTFPRLVGSGLRKINVGINEKCLCACVVMLGSPICTHFLWTWPCPSTSNGFPSPWRTLY